MPHCCRKVIDQGARLWQLPQKSAADAGDYCVQQSVLGPVGAAVPPTALIGEQAAGVGVPEN